MQTDFPEHPVYAALRSHDYARVRRHAPRTSASAAQLPPFTHAALLAAEAHQRDDVDAFLRGGARGGDGARAAHGDVEVFSPVPALLARRAGFERGQIVVQSARRPALQRFLAAWREALDALPGPARALGARRRPGRLRMSGRTAIIAAFCCGDMQASVSDHQRTNSSKALAAGRCAGVRCRAHAGTPVVVERPKQAAHGDYATQRRACARQAGAAQSARARDGASSPRCRRRRRSQAREVAGAGFINITLTPAARQAVVQRVLDRGRGVRQVAAHAPASR